MDTINSKEDTNISLVKITKLKPSWKNLQIFHDTYLGKIYQTSRNDKAKFAEMKQEFKLGMKDPVIKAEYLEKWKVYENK